MAKGIIGGMTDYSHQSFDDILTDLNEERKRTSSFRVTIQRTRRCSRRLEKGEDCVVGRVAVLLGCLDD